MSEPDEPIVNICVTQEDIDNGNQGDAHFCPIALAIRRQYDLPPTREAVAVGDYFVDFPQHIYVLPPEAQDFVMLFDEGERSKPFCFDMELDAQA